MIESIPHNIEQLMPTLKAYQTIITDPWIRKMVPERKDIGSFFFEIGDGNFVAWLNSL